MTSPREIALTWMALIVAVVVVNIALPQPFGPFALSEIFEPYLVLTGLMAGTVAIRAPRPAGRVLTLILVLTALARYGPTWISFPPEAAASSLRVATWNIEAGEDAASRAMLGISALDAQLIALQEVEPEAWAALRHGPNTLKFGALAAAPGLMGVGLLSRYPIIETQMSPDPSVLRAVVEPPGAGPIVVYVAHAPLARFATLGGVPVGIDLSVRDAAITLIRARIDEDVAQHRRVIILGDFNTTEREGAYARLAEGLRDAHLDAGTEPGLTWRPGPLSVLPIGMLRIDYVLSTSDLVATSSTTDCSVPSDHCRVDVELRMTAEMDAP